MQKQTSCVSRLLGGIGLALVLAGCAHKLQVNTNPAGSLVTVRNPAGKPVQTGIAPVVAKVKYSTSGNEVYTVEVTPPSAVADRYITNHVQVGSSTYARLPEVEPKVRRLDVKLEDTKFLVLPYVEVVLDARRTWQGVVTRSRAYKDVSEAGGAVPARVVDFGDNIGVQSMALAPDGNRIVYSLATYSLVPADLQNLLARAELRFIPIAGANLHAVTLSAGGIETITAENFRDFSPSFTFDGEKLLFSSNRRRAGAEDILMISAVRRSGISDIYVHRDARILRPTQGQDGTIAFAVDEPNPIEQKQRFTIWTLGGPNQFPTQIQVGSQPAISPDGKRIAYIGVDGNLWVVNTDGSAATQLSSGADQILERYQKSLGLDELARYEAFVRDVGFPEKMPFSYPSWSKDGRSILYTAMEGSDSTGRPNEDIWVMQYDGSGKKQLTTNGSIDRYPLLTPDGKWCYFMSNRGGRWAIWRIPGIAAP